MTPFEPIIGRTAFIGLLAELFILWAFPQHIINLYIEDNTFYVNINFNIELSLCFVYLIVQISDN
jgi:hypothetical protein